MLIRVARNSKSPGPVDYRGLSAALWQPRCSSCVNFLHCISSLADSVPSASHLSSVCLPSLCSRCFFALLCKNKPSQLSGPHGLSSLLGLCLIVSSWCLQPNLSAVLRSSQMSELLSSPWSESKEKHNEKQQEKKKFLSWIPCKGIPCHLIK